jgi:hypothetical protein
VYAEYWHDLSVYWNVWQQVGLYWPWVNPSMLPTERFQRFNIKKLISSKIFTLMKYDSYSRFLKSQMYKDCIVYEMEGKQMSRLVASMTSANPLPFNPGSLTALTIDNNVASNSTSGESSRTKDKKRSTMLIPWTKGRRLHC